MEGSGMDRMMDGKCSQEGWKEEKGEGREGRKEGNGKGQRAGWTDRGDTSI